MVSILSSPQSQNINSATTDQQISEILDPVIKKRYSVMIPAR
jgi:hypothetical protein